MEKDNDIFGLMTKHGVTKDDMFKMESGSIVKIDCNSCYGYEIHEKICTYEWKCKNCGDVKNIS